MQLYAITYIHHGSIFDKYTVLAAGAPSSAALPTTDDVLGTEAKRGSVYTKRKKYYAI